MKPIDPNDVVKLIGKSEINVCVICKENIDLDETCIFFRRLYSEDGPTGVAHEDCAFESSRGTLRDGWTRWWDTGTSNRLTLEEEEDYLNQRANIVRTMLGLPLLPRLKEPR